MNERIKEIRKEANLTQQEFADRLNVSKNNIINYEYGRRTPSAAVIQLICREFHVSQEWLETGIGEMYAPQTKNNYISEWVTRVLADQDDDIKKKFIYALTNVSDEGWEMIAKFVADITAQTEESADPVNPDK